MFLIDPNNAELPHANYSGSDKTILQRQKNHMLLSVAYNLALYRIKMETDLPGQYDLYGVVAPNLGTIPGIEPIGTHDRSFEQFFRWNL